jgi:hypothetical protein
MSVEIQGYSHDALGITACGGEPCVAKLAHHPVDVGIGKGYGNGGGWAGTSGGEHDEKDEG